MRERKINNKLLTYYLNLAELGDKDAEVKAKEIGKKMFFEGETEVKMSSKIKVIFPTGTVKEYNSAKEVMTKFFMDLETLRNCIEYGHVDNAGRMFEQIESRKK
ncbi:hypothetical protein [Enterococcus rivorum]|uniref:Uncharacterized protein n=1 Tax=Enterococcus rivorum TaxID=762845 RepID=A0A1E5KYH6_9ENTE|nr:hypothetical protein [Enterococcus rivorum]MBP2099541.1 hypothetical protein [Enterococcus rivorum]OEH82915.1 hypothetical protein BCR26_11300 [Enterococcus rivorum]